MAKLTTSYIMTLLTVCNDVPAELIDGQVYVGENGTCINVTDCSENDLQFFVEKYQPTK